MQEVNLLELQKLCAERKITWRDHALQRMKSRKISRADVKHCIEMGEIIEQYPADHPCASCLIFGATINGENLHAVCSIYEDLACIITAYCPNTMKWEPDFKTGKAAD